VSRQDDGPRVWVIRAGRHGEDEDAALEEGRAVVRFGEFGDLNRYGSVEELITGFLEKNPGSPRRRAENYARQLWALREKIQPGDIVVLPLKTRPGQIAVGRVKGPYQYAEVRGEKRHTRPVEWTRPDLPRSTFQQDLLHSFGAFITICRIQRNDAERRVLAVLEGKPDPGPPVGLSTTEGREDEASHEAASRLDLEQAASDEITAFIRARFPDHDMARLVEAVLRAEGFQVQRSAPGPDGGADILAGSGPLGLDPPYLCVQVKATETPVDVKVFRELAGTMTAFKASQGLLVSWGGFKQSVLREARQETFRIRLWDQSDLVQAIYRSYEKLPEEIQAELPLKRVWMLVHEEKGEE
jgi:restriction system protein